MVAFGNRGYHSEEPRQAFCLREREKERDRAREIEQNTMTSTKKLNTNFDWHPEGKVLPPPIKVVCQTTVPVTTLNTNLGDMSCLTC